MTAIQPWFDNWNYILIQKFLKFIVIQSDMWSTVKLFVSLVQITLIKMNHF